MINSIFNFVFKSLNDGEYTIRVKITAIGRNIPEKKYSMNLKEE
jgi:hypothetical protein